MKSQTKGAKMDKKTVWLFLFLVGSFLSTNAYFYGDTTLKFFRVICVSIVGLLVPCIRQLTVDLICQFLKAVYDMVLRKARAYPIEKFVKSNVAGRRKSTRLCLDQTTKIEMIHPRRGNYRLPCRLVNVCELGACIQADSDLKVKAGDVLLMSLSVMKNDLAPEINKLLKESSGRFQVVYRNSENRIGLKTYKE
jgi:hypothetical protein